MKRITISILLLVIIATNMTWADEWRKKADLQTLRWGASASVVDKRYISLEEDTGEYP